MKLKDRFPPQSVRDHLTSSSTEEQWPPLGLRLSEEFIKSIEESFSPEDKTLLEAEFKKAKDISDRISLLNEADDINAQKKIKGYIEINANRDAVRKSWAAIPDARIRFWIFNKQWNAAGPLAYSLIFELPTDTALFADLIRDLFIQDKVEFVSYLRENHKLITTNILKCLWTVSSGMDLSLMGGFANILINDLERSLEDRLNFARLTLRYDSWISAGVAKENISNLVNQLRVKHSLEDVPDDWIIEAYGSTECE